MNKLYSLTRFKKTYITLAIALFLYPTLGRGQGLCPPVGLPFYEDFNTTQLLPECWNKGENFDAEEMKAHVVSTPVYAGNGALMMSCGANNDTAHICYVMGPVLSQSPTKGSQPSSIWKRSPGFSTLAQPLRSSVIDWAEMS